MPNKIQIENGNKKGQIKKLIFAYIDFEDFDDLNKHHWYLGAHHGINYPEAHIPISNITGGKMTSSKMTIGHYLIRPPKGKYVKYRDRDPFNCRRENLYVA